MSKEVAILRKEVTKLGGTLSQKGYKTSNVPIDRTINNTSSPTQEMHNSRINVNQDLRHNTPERHSPQTEASTTPVTPPHAEWLNGCFYDRIGLISEQRTEVNIMTFDGVLVAKGYTTESYLLGKGTM